MSNLPQEVQQLLEQLRLVAGVELRQLNGSEPTEHQLRHAYAVATTQQQPPQPERKLRLVG